MIAGRCKCDFCGFISEMAGNPVQKSAMTMPEGWVSVHPMIVVHGMRGMKLSDKRYDDFKLMKDKVKQKVESLHICPRCLTDRDVFDMSRALPPTAQVVKENHMRANSVPTR